MQRHVRIGERDVVYTLRQSKRAKHLRVSVKCDGSVVVTAPGFLSGSVLEWLVERFLLEKANWIVSKVAFFKQFAGAPAVRLTKVHYKKYKAQAAALIEARVSHFNALYRLPVGRISVKNQKTLWGSCTERGNLNFSYKLLFLSEKLRDYVIVHEICHIKEFNHGKAFWSLVARGCPEYRELRKEVRKTVL